ncbi:MAG: dicarboxylate/amino acid:cation symporter [Oscillospiraceae bacterium]|nr:dicarboxylate/amino acid:cation symporter [Oscillospiraceae bacterium]
MAQFLKKLLQKYRDIQIFTKVIVGFAVGIILGLVFGESVAFLEILGDIFLRLLRMIVIPLVFFMLVSAMTEVGASKSLGKVGVYTTVLYTLTTVPAIITGIALAFIMNVGGGVELDLAATYEVAYVAVPPLIQTLVNIIPENVFTALTRADLLQVMFFAIFLGLCINKINDSRVQVLKDSINMMSEACKKMVNIILAFTPFGVMGLMAWAIGAFGLEILLPFGRMIIAVYIGCAFHILFFQGFIMAKVFGKMRYFAFFKIAKGAMLTAFATASSLAAMPVTYEATRKAGVPEKIANFTIPYGTVINMDGSAIYQAIAVIFVAQFQGVALEFNQLIMIVVAGTLVSIGTATVPGAALVTLSAVLASVGLEAGALIGLLFGIDRIVTMPRVVPNATGDISVSRVVTRICGLLEKSDIDSGSLKSGSEPPSVT